jgi:hypothetical protein
VNGATSKPLHIDWALFGVRHVVPPVQEELTSHFVEQFARSPFLGMIPKFYCIMMASFGERTVVVTRLKLLLRSKMTMQTTIGEHGLYSVYARRSHRPLSFSICATDIAFLGL